MMTFVNILLNYTFICYALSFSYGVFLLYNLFFHPNKFKDIMNNIYKLMGVGITPNRDSDGNYYSDQKRKENINSSLIIGIFLSPVFIPLGIIHIIYVKAYIILNNND